MILVSIYVFDKPKWSLNESCILIHYSTDSPIQFHDIDVKRMNMRYCVLCWFNYDKQCEGRVLLKE